MKKILFVLILFLLGGCAKDSSTIVEIPQPLEEIKTENEAPPSKGSLWPGEQHSLFADHKARTIGDIVTVTISETASATKEATTDTARSSSMQAGIPHLFGIENSSIITNNPKMDISQLVEASLSNSFQGSGKTVRKEDLNAFLTTQVIDVYPNGNLKIRGGKEVQVNDEVQVIYLTGIVRPVDIMANNLVDSKYLLNARISYTGKGPITDKQKAGWLMRVLDNVWPF
jgi:flagellar L-ring protein precursor FlgH